MVGLYKKRYFLTETGTAIWDDTPTIGVWQTVKVYEQKYGPFDNRQDVETKKRELEELLKQMAEKNLWEIRRKFHIPFKASDFEVIYKVSDDFEKLTDL